MQRRQLVIGSAAAVAAVALLSGCAALNTLSSEVSSFGQWPQGRAPGTYMIERLPSQASGAAGAAGAAGASNAKNSQAAVEQAAHQALRRAGFTPATDLASADVVVQIGGRITRYDMSPWADPLWWRWGSGYWRGPGWPAGRGVIGGAYWRHPPPADREVAILLRDRATSIPLWEARAVSSGNATGPEVFDAMFAAAMTDFPKARPEPHTVTLPLNP